MLWSRCRGLLALAAVVGLVAIAVTAQPDVSDSGKNTEQQIRAVLDRYRAAMEAKSLDALAQVMDPNLLLYEGLHKNDSWQDYRDNHIKQHFQEWQEFKMQDTKIIELSYSNDLGYAVQEATTKVTPVGGEAKTNSVVQTFVFKKGPHGWKIKHIHAFSKRKEDPKASDK